MEKGIKKTEKQTSRGERGINKNGILWRTFGKEDVLGLVCALKENIDSKIQV